MDQELIDNLRVKLLCDIEYCVQYQGLGQTDCDIMRKIQRSMTWSIWNFFHVKLCL